MTQISISTKKRRGSCILLLLFLEHYQEIINRLSRHAHDVHGSAGSQFNGDTRYSVIVRSFNDINEIISSQNRVLLKNLSAESLNLFVDFLDSLRSFLNRFSAFRSEGRQENVDGHKIPKRIVSAQQFKYFEDLLITKWNTLNLVLVSRSAHLASRLTQTMPGI